MLFYELFYAQTNSNRPRKLYWGTNSNFKKYYPHLDNQINAIIYLTAQILNQIFKFDSLFV